MRLLGRSAGSAALAALLVGTAGCAESPDDHAFEVTRPTTTFIGIGVTEGARKFHVSVPLDHPGSALQIIDVDAHVSANVDFLGAVAVWPRDIKKYNAGAGVGYPPANVKGTHPISEPVSPAETLFEPKGFGGPGAVSVVAGFRLREGEIGSMNGVRVIYEVDGERTLKDSPQAGIACLEPKGCKGPTGSDDPDFQYRILREAGLLPEDD